MPSFALVGFLLRELLARWWAQQLTLCGWPLVDDPRRALTSDAAFERLVAQGVGDRDEFSWRLWESAIDMEEAAPSRLAALELLALGAVAGWIRPEVDGIWLRYLAHDIVTMHATLNQWLKALTPLGDAIPVVVANALRMAERQGRGAAWKAVQRHLEERGEMPSLWSSDLWRARAAFAPVLDWPFEPDSEERRQHRRMLREQGEIGEREALLTSLFWLGEQGDRYGWDMDAVRVARQDQRESLEWLASLNDQQNYGRVLLRFLADDEPLEWAAWDWLRLVDQAYWGYIAGWLSASEAEAFAAHAVDLIQRRYADWEAVARAYQRGRSLFEGRDLRAAFGADWDRLLRAPHSPWQLPLSDILDERLRDAGRAWISAHYDSADDWVLAIASVREPDLVYRHRLDETLDSIRRQDAERYLDDVLMLRRDEGIEGLARFWMPAQAHHLNQLAADARSGRNKEGNRRSGLSACAEHAATIMMAEKYAFYLLMAADSGRYSAAAIEVRARSLRDVLCRFYVDASRLLSAWLAWESVLAEEEAPGEVPLLDDIRWHLDDPGSRFHWLSASTGMVWTEPGPRPTLARFTAMSLAGPLNEALWQTPQPLAAEDRSALAEWLEHQYALQGAAGLVAFLDFLVEAGDRQEYQINYAPYTLNPARLDAEIAILESGECGEEERVHLVRLQRVRDNDCRCNEEDLTAWDVAQLVDLALAGRQLQWLDEEQLSRYLDAATELAGRHYGNWRDYAKGLYSGFAFFMDDTPERAAFLTRFRQALDAWLTAKPLLAGAWASLDFPAGPGRHWTPLHIDILPGEPEHLH